MVEVDEGHELACAVDDDGLDYIVLVVHDGLDLLRVDILAVRAENHALAAALDEDIAVSVNDSQVTGLQKTVSGEGGRGRFRILVITQTDVSSLRLDFADHVLRVIGVNAYRSAIHGFPHEPGTYEVHGS